MAKNVSQKEFKRLLGILAGLLAVVLLVGSVLAFKGYSFAINQVREQLVQEKIKFPEAGTPALDPKEFPGLQKYAGQAVDNGVKAKAYANEFIWVHMMKSSGGKTYAQVSEESRANPNDQKLAALKNTLFQGDMLRSSLLSAYAFSVFGVVAGYTAWICLAGAILLFLITLMLFAGSRRS